MIDYKTAVILKEAGFPQKPAIQFSETLAVQEAAYTPTLSELIEACGEKFTSLNYQKTCNGNWRANFIQGEPLNIVREFGDSPEEAVANLWLALNSKD